MAWSNNQNNIYPTLLFNEQTQNPEGSRQAPFAPSLPSWVNNITLYPQPQSSPMGNIQFSNLMQPVPPKPNPFMEITLADLLDSRRPFAAHPNSKEFKVILFNDAMRTCQFGFKPELIADVRTALLTVTAPSYKFLASVAICIAQTKAVIAQLKDKGTLYLTKFTLLLSKLTKYAEDCTNIGNAYHDRLIAKPAFDPSVAFLVIQMHGDRRFRNLFKQSFKIDEDLKKFMGDLPDIRAGIAQNLDSIVNTFIYNYFQLQQVIPAGAGQLQLNDYIDPNALSRIRALFADDSRDKLKGHQFNACGIEHLYDCYAEMFDHFITTR